MKIAIIPARGGSKRIPRKNIRSFAGRPMIAYPILAAAESGIFNRIVVSTDDTEIAEIARRFGAEIPFLRPAELADDYTGTIDVVKHAIRWHRDQGVPVSYVCCIYATSPLLRARYLREGLDQLMATGKSYAFSVTSYAFPVQRALRIAPSNGIEAICPEHIFTRSQDLEEAYHDAGQFYWGRSQAFLNDEVIFSAASVPIILPRHLVQDIDTLEDWRRAELMYQAWQMVKDEDA